MDRVDADKQKDLEVPAYAAVARTTNMAIEELSYVERFEFYKKAKACFCVVQTDDVTLYANIIISKGVIS
jgi:L-fucose mutarotase